MHDRSSAAATCQIVSSSSRIGGKREARPALLISPEVFDKVQERRKAKAPKLKNIGGHFALRGIVCCADVTSRCARRSPRAVAGTTITISDGPRAARPTESRSSATRSKAMWAR